jgi:hypothetical protein
MVAVEFENGATISDGVAVGWTVTVVVDGAEHSSAATVGAEATTVIVIVTTEQTLSLSAGGRIATDVTAGELDWVLTISPDPPTAATVVVAA